MSEGHLKFNFVEAGADPELDFEGWRLNCLFHVKSFLSLLFAVRNVSVWGPWPPGIRPAIDKYNRDHRYL